jgi:hypothetical protein
MQLKNVKLLYELFVIVKMVVPGYSNISPNAYL